LKHGVHLCQKNTNVCFAFVRNLIKRARHELKHEKELLTKNVGFIVMHAEKILNASTAVLRIRIRYGAP